MGRVRSACFSWLGPGSHILPHVDAYYPNVIRAHIGLQVPPQSLVRVAAARCELAPGEVVMIDGQVEHEVANLSPTPRITLLVDVEMTPREARFVLAHSPRRVALDAAAAGLMR
jgi:aspartyl/asparaginyl beta-hydroxylase (cupin superfamily)